MSLGKGTFSLEPSLLYNETCADPDSFFQRILTIIHSKMVFIETYNKKQRIVD